MSEAWLQALAKACDAFGQGAVAQRIGYSTGTVSGVLSGTYKGNWQRVRAAVEGALMRAEVDCPVCGEIPRQRCVEHQRRPFRPTNPAAVQLYRACRGGCVHSLIGAKSAGEK